MSVFDKRVAFKPFEYPEVLEYGKAIQHSYWLVSEFNFLSDVQDFHVKLNDIERRAVKNAILAISQIEVSVKRFWTKLGDRFPKAEFEMTGVIFGESECYDAETEVLTSKGWVRFPNLSRDDDVAQYNHKTEEISFVRPTAYVDRPYKGVMHHYFSRSSDLMVTPNHEILVKHPAKFVYEKKKSEDGKWGCNYRFPTSGYLKPKTTTTFTDLDRLLVAIQADGSLYGCTPSGAGRQDACINVKKSRKVERIRELLNNLDIKYKEGDRAQGITSFNFPLPPHIDVTQVKNFGYIDITKIDKEYVKQFLEELRLWDSGSKPTLDSFTYYNANVDAIDKVQAMATLAGFSSCKGINRTWQDSLKRLLPGGVAKKSAKTVYALSITNTAMHTYPYRTEIEYDGNVYCVTVPDGNIVTRRNKITTISGNCRHALAYSHLLEVLGFNSEFDQLLQNPVIQGRVDYLTKYLKGASDNSNENFSLSLALFSLFIENVSLFSQFLIIKSFNKHKKTLKDIDNVIQATMVEEMLHAMLGAYILNKIKEEFPDWFNDDFYDKIYRASKKAYEAEEKIIDWIFEEGELSFLPKNTVKEFTKDRFNQSLLMIGGKPVFEVDKSKLDVIKWFNEELETETAADFFWKRPTSYSKKMQPSKAEDLF